MSGLAVPGPDAISGAKDAAGEDLWFNGEKPFAPNPLLLGPSGGKRIDGSKVVANGLSLSDGPAKPWTVTFPERGSYTLRSLLHPGVKLTVVVKRKGSTVPWP